MKTDFREPISHQPAHSANGVWAGRQFVDRKIKGRVIQVVGWDMERSKWKVLTILPERGHISYINANRMRNGYDPVDAKTERST